MTTLTRVQEHYTVQEMPARIENALQQAGLGAGEIDWSALAALDQFHTRGLAATKELAEAMGLTGTDSILDVGSGLGGPARYLAAVYGCSVIGIELTPQYIEIAAMLSERTGLSGHTRFVQGDALEMPFEPETFDHALTQHVAMNIPDKSALYQGIHRVLKPGGRLALFDVVKGGTDQGGTDKGGTDSVIYPVPWAAEPAFSFLVTPAELRQALEQAGFRLVSEADTTEAALIWFSEMQTAPPLPLSLGAVIGPQIQSAVANLGRNLKEGRVRVVQTIVQKK